MSEKDWSRILTEDQVTMEMNFETGTKEFRPCRAELASPATDWDFTWTLCRQQGLSPKMSSFFWKMLLDLLCTQERLHRVGASPSPLCKLCKQETGSLQHELIECTFNDNAGRLLLNCLQTTIPNLSAETLLRLEFANLENDMQLPTTMLVAATLGCIWKERNINSRVCIYQVRSQLEQSVNLLRTTRLTPAAETWNTFLNQMFN